MASKFYNSIYKDSFAANMAQIAKEAKETVLSTGDPSLDYTLGGGWARHRMNTIYGPTGSFKSFLACMGCAQAQKEEQGDVIIWDSEFYYRDPTVAQRLKLMGLDLDRVHVISSNRVSGLYGGLADLETDLKSGNIKISAMLTDSVGGIQGDLAEAKVLKGDTEDAGNAGRGNAKYLNPVYGVLLRLCAEHSITSFFVQHCIDNQESYGVQYKIIGGHRLKLLSHSILFVEGATGQDSKLLAGDLRSKVDVKVEEAYKMQSYGKKVLCRCDKSRNTQEGSKGEFFINSEECRFARIEESLANLAINLGVIGHPTNEEGKENSGWWSFQQGISTPVKFQGQKKLIEGLGNKELYKKVWEACLASKKLSATNDDISDVILTKD